MPSWADDGARGPGAGRERRGAFLMARTHRTIATMRRDGAPRISGTEMRIADGELWFGSMWRSNKALDLLRDPRFSLHSGIEDPPAWAGDATVSRDGGRGRPGAHRARSTARPRRAPRTSSAPTSPS